MIGIVCVIFVRLKNDASIKLGDVTSINMTMLSGGVQPNVVPSELSASNRHINKFLFILSPSI